MKYKGRRFPVSRRTPSRGRRCAAFCVPLAALALAAVGCGGSKAGATGQGGSGGATDNDGGGGAEADAAPPVTISDPWDWAGIIGTGQSLEVGQMGTPIKGNGQ